MLNNKTNNIYPCNNDTELDQDTSLEDQVTIFIPTYKNEHLVLSCVKSCLEQSHKNIVVIVVDNGFGEFGDSLKTKLTTFEDSRLYYRPNVSNIELQGNFHLILSIAEETNLFIVIAADILLASHAVEKMINAYKSDPSVSLVYGRTIVRDIGQYKITTDIDLGGVVNPWPYKESSNYDTTQVINYFFKMNNIDSDLSHFSFIGSLINGSLIKSIGLKRVPMFYHGWEEYISLTVLSYSKKIAILNDPLLILYTNNERFGWAARTKLNYTRFEPVLTEYKYLSEHEALLIKRGLSLFKLNGFLLIKTFYTMIRYPGVIFFIIPNFFSALIKTVCILFPVEMYFFIRRFLVRSVTHFKN